MASFPVLTSPVDVIDATTLRGSRFLHDDGSDDLVHLHRPLERQLRRDELRLGRRPGDDFAGHGPLRVQRNGRVPAPGPAITLQ